MSHTPEKEPITPVIEAPVLSAGEQQEVVGAVETLRELGLLESVGGLDVYHGRVEDPEESGQWSIDPDFDNAGDNSGNRNVNQRPTLYTCNFEDAIKFGRARGANTARELVLQRFIRDVENYDGEQQQSWLDRLNQQARESWQRIEDSEGVTHRKGDEQPKVYKPEDLNDQQTRWEAIRLRREDDETRSRYWAEEAQAYQVSVYAIESEDPTLSVLDEDFDLTELDTDDPEANMKKLEEALNILAPDIDDMIPQELGSGGTALKQRVINEYNHRLKQADVLEEEPTLSHDDVGRISEDMELPAEYVRTIVGSLNAKALWLRDAPAAVWLFLGKNRTFSDRLNEDFETPEDTETYKDGEREIPVNTLYLAKLLQRAAIVGEESEVKSATLGKKLKVVSFFDLSHLKAVYKPAEKPTE